MRPSCLRDTGMTPTGDCCTSVTRLYVPAGSSRLRLDRTSSSGLIKTRGEILDRKGTPTGVFTKWYEIDKFVAKFKVPEQSTEEAEDEASEDPESFEFSPYPKLLSSLRLVEAFGADTVATELDSEVTREVLRNLLAISSAYKELEGLRELQAMAAAVEELLHESGASPALSTLTAANTAPQHSLAGRCARSHLSTRHALVVLWIALCLT